MKWNLERDLAVNLSWLLKHQKRGRNHSLEVIVPPLLDVSLLCSPAPHYVSTSDLHALTYRIPRQGMWRSWTMTHCGQWTCSGYSWPCSICCCRCSKAGSTETMTADSTTPRPWWCCSRRLCRGLWCRWRSRSLCECKMILAQKSKVKGEIWAMFFIKPEGISMKV